MSLTDQARATRIIGDSFFDEGAATREGWPGRELLTLLGSAYHRAALRTEAAHETEIAQSGVHVVAES